MTQDSRRIGTPKEMFEGETRVAMTPDSAALLQKLGYVCAIQAEAGEAAKVKVIRTATMLTKNG